MPGVKTEAILMSVGCAVARAIQILVVYTASHGYGDIQTQAAAKDCIWVCDPTTAGGSVDVCGLCYLQRPQAWPRSTLSRNVPHLTTGMREVALMIWA